MMIDSVGTANGWITKSRFVRYKCKLKLESFSCANKMGRRNVEVWKRWQLCEWFLTGGGEHTKRTVIFEYNIYICLYRYTQQIVYRAMVNVPEILRWNHSQIYGGTPINLLRYSYILLPYQGKLFKVADVHCCCRFCSLQSARNWLW